MGDAGILLGYEVGTGEEVRMRLAHTVVTGMSQLSGKTTTLQAIIDRSGLRAIAFKTKRGEAGFNNYREVLPYFREQVWMYALTLDTEEIHHIVNALGDVVDAQKMRILQRLRPVETKALFKSMGGGEP